MKLIIATLIAALLLGILASCGSGSDSEPSRTASPSPSPSPTQSPSPAPTSPSLGPATFDAARAMGHVNALSVDIGIRAAGGAGERKAAVYLRDELASYGYEASLQPFAIEGYVPGVAKLQVNGQNARSIDAAALASSATGEVTAPVVVAGLGYPDDFPAHTDSKIALIERGELFFTDKVANAADAGAVGVIIYNNEPGGFGGQVSDAHGIPGVTISREDGLSLVNAVQGGGLTVSLSVTPATVGTESNNVIARPPGGECRIVVGGHYDSVPDGPGANDNASGTGVAVEIARTLAADGEFDDVCVVLFGSEEIGLVGSNYYVASLSADERENLEAMLNFDMLAVGDRWPLGGSTELVKVAGEAAEAAGIPYTIESLPEGVGSDHAPFQIAGIPAIIFNCFCDPNYHTAGDRAEFVSEGRLGEAGAIGIGTLERLLMS